jgi:hypothetical protein
MASFWRVVRSFLLPLLFFVPSSASLYALVGGLYISFSHIETFVSVGFYYMDPAAHSKESIWALLLVSLTCKEFFTNLEFRGKGSSFGEL